MRLKKRDGLVFLGLFVLLLFLALNRHSKHPIFEYHAEIFSDKAGYHVYLPALFYYNFDGNKFPPNIAEKTGKGFEIIEGKVITKYPIGVAIFQLPFFSIAAIFENLTAQKHNLGFGKIQHRAIDWATAFYGTLALLFLFITATRFLNLGRKKAYLLLLLLVGSSNLLYYLTRDCGMSHAYSFFVFSALLLIIYSCHKNGVITWQQIGLIGLLLGLVIALRQINGFFLLFPILYLFYNLHGKIRITVPVFTKGLLFAILLGSIPIVLQLMYNQYAYNNWLADTYKNESFSNWNNLELIRFWLSPDNGALLYSPVFILVIWGSWVGIRKYGISAIVFIIYLLVIGFTYAAWWSPGLGCGFGNRGFSEHLAFFSLPCIWLLQSFNKRTTKVMWVVAIIAFLLLFIAQYNFDGCWYGKGPWDWNYYFGLFKI